MSQTGDAPPESTDPLFAGRSGVARDMAAVDWAATPLVLVVNVVSLFFLVFHAITWFNLAPRAMVVKVGGKRVPGVLIAASNYAAWAVATVVVAWLLVGR